MKIFVTGTDTNVGKTVICSWLCQQLNYAYWKPIQTGAIEGTDSEFILKSNLSSKLYAEKYIFDEPVSPHLAATLNNGEINIQNIHLPDTDNLIIEGAGGVFVPLNNQDLMIDLMAKFKTPVILVARSSLGAINHTLLSIYALNSRHIPILGVILNNYIADSDLHLKNKEAIEHYGQVAVLACFPHLDNFSCEKIKKINISSKLKEIFE